MNNVAFSRRQFLKTMILAAGTFIVSPAIARRALTTQTESATPEHVLHIKNSVVEIAPNASPRRPLTTASCFVGQPDWRKDVLKIDLLQMKYRL